MNTSQICVLLALVGILLVGSVPSNAAWKQDRFIVTAYCTPPAEDGPLAAFAGEGYNLTWAPADKLDLVRKYGLRAMVQDGLLQASTLDTPEQRAKLDELINRVKNHPAMGGYYLIDEPGASSFEGWGKLVAYLKERDPKHMAYINLFPTYAQAEGQLNVSPDDIKKASETPDGVFTPTANRGGNMDVAWAYKAYLQRFIDTVKPELISWDHYHFEQSGDGTQYFLNLELIRDTALKAKLPFLNIIQANTIVSTWRRTTIDEMRFLIYTTMAYGGRGISYFTYWGPVEYHGLYEDGKQTSHALDAAALNKGMNAIGPELMKLKSVGVYHSKEIPWGGRPVPADCPVQVESLTPCVLGLFGDKTEVEAFMLVNRDYKNPAQVNLYFTKGIKSLREFSRETGKWKNLGKVMTGRPLFITVEPGDGRLFRLVR